MTVNLHTHTARCFHAEGSDEAYVTAAIEGGLKTLGFSDHTPHWFPGDYYSHMRMFPEQLEDYIQSVLSLKEAYKEQIDIHLGLEVEYYPGVFPELMHRLRDTPVEYMLLGQHWVGDEENEPYCGRATEDAHTLQRYCDQAIAGMETGLFTYLAHPDLIHYVGDPKIYTRHIRRLCKAAKGCGIPLEINMLGLRARRHYPNPLLWEIAAEEGCPVVLGSDAHTPKDVWVPENRAQALQIIKQFQLTLIQAPEIRKL